MKTLLLLPLLVAACSGDKPQPEGQPRQGNLSARIPVPEFKFLEAQDRPLRLKDLKGKVWICTFIFTRCKTHCPPMAVEMSTIQDEFLKEPDFRIVAVTVDPAYDKPKQMREYLTEYDSKPERWYFVTGNRKDIEAFRRGIKISGDPEEPLNHTVYFALVDKQARVRDYYLQTDDDRMDTLRKDIKTLLAE